MAEHTILREPRQAIPMGGIFNPMEWAMIDRLAGTWRWWGEEHGYFASEDDAFLLGADLLVVPTLTSTPNRGRWKLTSFCVPV